MAQVHVLTHPERRQRFSIGLAREAPDMIPACVGEIARFWRARRAAARIGPSTLLGHRFTVA
jgi:hypothetical protein